MKNNKLSILVGLSLLACSLQAKDYLLSTPSTSLLISASKGEKSKHQYYGARINELDIKSIYDAGQALNAQTYPVFGLQIPNQQAMSVTHADGNMTLDLVVDQVEQTNSNKAEILEITLKDAVYPFTVKQIFKAYKNSDIISTWVEVTNNGKKPITLYKFASAYLPLLRNENWMSHFGGTWGDENGLFEESLQNGLKVITNTSGTRNTQTDNPSLMITMNGKPQEESGDVFGGTLVWPGNYTLSVDTRKTSLGVIAGIKEDNSHYTLEPRETFVTPEFAMTYSTSGKGGVSRAFHRWARQYKLNQGSTPRDVLLNSWEGVYFKVNQEEMDNMMESFSAMGGELFVMDDGWFGNKYPRNNGSTSLGDWEVCKEKLPNGIEGLLESADKNNIKFGIWIEPEMANTKSELFEKHPEWVLQAKSRNISTGRGGTQVVLDLTNPKVQDFVFNVVDNLMTKHPNIAYIKWDSNSDLMDYGSTYLSKDKQSHLYIEYNKGLIQTLERIRAKYPNVVMQACASGGGRVNYGLLPYYNEFWTSDNTDALQRIYMQWGVSNFYPAIAMASHVSANKNHQTGRTIPLKFRFDVAMSGRLGMEIQPKDMSESDKAFAVRAIDSYKQIRPIVQFGDLYRLVSPHEKKSIASLMYVSPQKNEAVLFAYKISHFLNSNTPSVKLNGLNPDKTYRITDLTPTDSNKPNSLNGKEIRGKVLMDKGLNLRSALDSEYASIALRLEQID